MYINSILYYNPMNMDGVGVLEEESNLQHTDMYILLRRNILGHETSPCETLKAL